MSDKRKYWQYTKYDWDGTTLAGGKLRAWAFAVGELPRAAGDVPRRRPHRGQLPDVDFDRAVADPTRRPVAVRLAGLLAGLLGYRPAPAGAAVTASLAEPVAESPGAPHISRGRAAGSDVGPAAAGAQAYDWSRAA